MDQPWGFPGAALRLVAVRRFRLAVRAECGPSAVGGRDARSLVPMPSTPGAPSFFSTRFSASRMLLRSTICSSKASNQGSGDGRSGWAEGGLGPPADPLRLHRFLPQAGPFRGFLLSLRVLRTCQGSSSSRRSALPSCGAPSW